MKKFVFSVILFLLLACLLEGAGMIMLRMLNGKWVSPETVVRDVAGGAATGTVDLQQHVEAPNRMPSYLQQHILHPYTGFVRNPDMANHDFVERIVPFPVNEFGFFGPSPMVKRSPDRVHVFVTGGSVALEFFIDAKEHLEQRLGELPQFAGKEITVYSLALGGFKQPQQTLLLTYLLALGAEPDMVLALDGFNEVVLPVVENLRNNVYPFFPRKWNVYGSSGLDMEAAVLAGAIAMRREEVDASKKQIRTSPVRKSRLGVALWQSAHRKKAIRRTESEQALQARLEQRTGVLPAQLTGPAFPPMSMPEIAEQCTEVWGRASRQLWELCRSHDIFYMQFLQPNQYVPDTKTFTDWEQQNAIGPQDYVWRICARYGYPVLMERGPELAAIGVPYSDLTDVYKNIPDTIYKDSCCHINALGARLLADRMVADLAPALAAQP